MTEPLLSRRSTLVRCALLFTVGLVVRLAYLGYFGIGSQKGGDMEGYIALARNLAQGHGFSFDGVTPTTYRPPLFSWWLGAWCYLLGGASLKAMVAFQVIVQTLCAPLTYLLVRQTQRSERFALCAGLFVAAYPFIFTNVDLILQEPTQMLVATAMGIAVVAWGRRPTPERCAIAGLLFGLGTLSKSPFLLAPAIALLVCLLGQTFRRQIPLRHAMWACLLTAVVVLPWTLRNYRVSGGRLALVNSQGPMYLIWMVADGNFDPRESLSEPPQEKPAPAQGVALTYGNAAGHEYLRRKNDELLMRGLYGPAVTEALGEAARTYMWSHPAYALRIVTRGAVLLFSPDAGVHLFRFFWTRVVAMIFFHLPLAVGLLAGMVKSLRERNAALSILSVFTAAYLLVHTPVAIAGGRYAVPVIPLLIAITGYVCLRDRSRPAPAALAMEAGSRYSSSSSSASISSGSNPCRMRLTRWRFSTSAR